MYATPRRVVVIAKNVAPRQDDEEFVAKGPPAERAFDADGNPTKAAQGFARGKGVDVADLYPGMSVEAFLRTEDRTFVEYLA